LLSKTKRYSTTTKNDTFVSNCERTSSCIHSSAISGGEKLKIFGASVKENSTVFGALVKAVRRVRKQLKDEPDMEFQFTSDDINTMILVGNFEEELEQKFEEDQMFGNDHEEGEGVEVSKPLCVGGRLHVLDEQEQKEVGQMEVDITLDTAATISGIDLKTLQHLPERGKQAFVRIRPFRNKISITGVGDCEVIAIGYLLVKITLGTSRIEHEFITAKFPVFQTLPVSVLV
jgi:hypothetical protein